MSQITTHILDTSLGKPAQDVPIELLQHEKDKWISIAKGRTNLDGRVANLLPKERVLKAGIYKLIFDVDSYHEQSDDSFYPFVEITFKVDEGGEHYHVPLLLNPFGYSTYRGS